VGHHLVTTWISEVHPHLCHPQVLAHLPPDTWSPHHLIPMTALPVTLFPQWTSHHREAAEVVVLRPQATHIPEVVEVVRQARAVEARDQTVSMSVMCTTSCVVHRPRPEAARRAAAAAGVVSGNIVIAMERGAVVMSITVAMNTADAKNTAPSPPSSSVTATHTLNFFITNFYITYIFFNDARKRLSDNRHSRQLIVIMRQ